MVNPLDPAYPWVDQNWSSEIKVPIRYLFYPIEIAFRLNILTLFYLIDFNLVGLNLKSLTPLTCMCMGMGT
jgi:hypothetical protein